MSSDVNGVLHHRISQIGGGAPIGTPAFPQQRGTLWPPAPMAPRHHDHMGDHVGAHHQYQHHPATENAVEYWAHVLAEQPVVAAALAGAAAMVVALIVIRFELWQRARAAIYDRVIVHMTKQWYAAVLERLPSDCRLLDVGIGTGSALLEPGNLATVRAKRLRVVGVDIDGDYVDACAASARRLGLEAPDGRGQSGGAAAAAAAGATAPAGDASLLVRLQSVYDFTWPTPFDAIYFSGSLMLMPDPATALSRTSRMLAPPLGGAGGVQPSIYVTQTFESKAGRASAAARCIACIKPLLKWVTTIDFGQATFRGDFEAVVEAAGLQVVEEQEIGRAVGGDRSFRMLVLRRRAAAPRPAAGAAPSAGLAAAEGAEGARRRK